MSYDAYMMIDTGRQSAIVQDIGNYTSNVSRMWFLALGGKRLGELDNKYGFEAAAELTNAIAYMERDQDTFRAMNPDNDWGDYQGALNYLKRIRDACLMHPIAKLSISN